MKVQFRCPPELTDILPRPYAAKRGMPDWLKRMAATAPSSDLNGEIRTVKQCPPFVDAMGLGFIWASSWQARQSPQRTVLR